MTLSLPWQFSQHDPAGPELEDRLQDVLDELAKQFPVGIQNTSQVPQVRVHASAAIAIPNNALTALTYDTEDWDTASLHSTAVNTGRLTANLAGLWRLDGHCQWAAAAGGVQRYAAIRLNGATTIAEQVKTNSATLLMQTSVGTQYRLAAGDYAELVFFQDSGGNLNVTASQFAMHWVSP